MRITLALQQFPSDNCCMPNTQAQFEVEEEDDAAAEYEAERADDDRDDGGDFFSWDGPL